MERKYTCKCHVCRFEGYTDEFISLKMHSGGKVYFCCENCLNAMTNKRIARLQIKYWFFYHLKIQFTLELNRIFNEWIKDFKIKELQLMDKFLNQKINIYEVMENECFKPSDSEELLFFFMEHIELMCELG